MKRKFLATLGMLMAGSALLVGCSSDSGTASTPSTPSTPSASSTSDSSSNSSSSDSSSSNTVQTELRINILSHVIRGNNTQLKEPNCGLHKFCQSHKANSVWNQFAKISWGSCCFIRRALTYCPLVVHRLHERLQLSVAVEENSEHKMKSETVSCLNEMRKKIC